MKSVVLTFHVKRIVIMFFIIVIFLSLSACDTDEKSDDVFINAGITDYVSTLYEHALSERVQTVSDNSFFFGGTDLGMSSTEIEEKVVENEWFVGCIEGIVSDIAEYGNEFYSSDIYLYTDDKDLVTVTAIFENNVLNYIGVQITYDVTNPSYEQFVALSRAHLRSFMDAEGIEEMSIVENCPDNVSYNLMLDTYTEAGYKTNEITYREYVDDESGVVYSYVVEHYEKEDPDESIQETSNIAKIFYSKTYAK